jgi:hypothetical protein
MLRATCRLNQNVFVGLCGLAANKRRLMDTTREPKGQWGEQGESKVMREGEDTTSCNSFIEICLARIT